MKTAAAAKLTARPEVHAYLISLTQAFGDRDPRVGVKAPTLAALDRAGLVERGEGYGNVVITIAGYRAITA